jgi:hypothetical protein
MDRGQSDCRVRNQSSRLGSMSTTGRTKTVRLEEACSEEKRNQNPKPTSIGAQRDDAEVTICSDEVSDNATRKRISYAVPLPEVEVNF